MAGIVLYCTISPHYPGVGRQWFVIFHVDIIMHWQQDGNNSLLQELIKIIYAVSLFDSISLVSLPESVSGLFVSVQKKIIINMIYLLHITITTNYLLCIQYPLYIL